MERLSKSKKRAGSDLPKRKRKHSGNDTLEHLREASVEIVNCVVSRMFIIIMGYSSGESMW